MDSFNWKQFYRVQLHQMLLGVLSGAIALALGLAFISYGNAGDFGSQVAGYFLSILIRIYSFFICFGVNELLYYQGWYKKKYKNFQRADFIIPFILGILFLLFILFHFLISSLSIDPIPTKY